MNTYRDNLRVTIKDTLASIRAEEGRHKTAVSIAADKLFFAEGAQSIANMRWEDSKQHHDKIHRISIQGVACGDRSNNLVNTADLAAKNVSELVLNTATAANNVQIAANAIAKLAARMGSAKNISFATLQGSNIDDQVKKAELKIRETAYKAETVTIDALQASSNAAQIMQPIVLDEVKATNAKFAEVEQATKAELDAATERVNAAQQNLSGLNTTLIVASGKLQAARKIYDGTVSSLASRNDTLNYNLNTQALSEKELKVKFDAYIPTPRDSRQETKSDGNRYFIFFINADLKQTITYENAENQFHKSASDRFYEVSDYKPAEGVDYFGKFERDLSSTATQPLLDIEGCNIEPGTPYVAYLFIQLNEKYKRKINNFNDQLSAPSNEFVLAKALPKVSTAKFEKNLAMVELDEEAKEKLQVRLMFIPVAKKNSAREHAELNKLVSSWFSTSIAEQVSRANYLLMEPMQKSGESKGDIAAKSGKSFSKKLAVGQTDVFGSLISDENQYMHIILTCVEEDSPEATQFKPALYLAGVNVVSLA